MTTETTKAGSGIEVTVDLSELILGSGYEDEPRRLEDVVLDAAAALVVKRVVDTSEGDDARRELFRQVRAVRSEEIREAVKPTIAEALSAAIQKTNTYGEPVGEPTTLRELILDEARDILTKARPNQDGYGRRRQESNVITELIKAEVEKAFATELRAEIKDEADRVRALVRAQAAEVLTEAMRRAIPL